MARGVQNHVNTVKKSVMLEGSVAALQNNAIQEKTGKSTTYIIVQAVAQYLAFLLFIDAFSEIIIQPACNKIFNNAYIY
jgi:hypothetical protein